MHSFVDSKGRRHEIEITVYSAQVAKDQAGIDLFSLLENDLAGLRELEADIGKFARLIYVLCCCTGDGEPTMTERDFARSLAGQPIDDAVKAFQDEYICFFRNRRVGAALQKVVEKIRQTQTDALEDLEAAVNAAVSQSRPQPSSGVSGNLPALSASTPARSVCVN